MANVNQILAIASHKASNRMCRAVARVGQADRTVMQIMFCPRHKRTKRTICVDRMSRSAGDALRLAVPWRRRRTCLMIIHRSVLSSCRYRRSPFFARNNVHWRYYVRLTTGISHLARLRHESVGHTLPRFEATRISVRFSPTDSLSLMHAVSEHAN
jgi:hypothetical protein